MYCILYVLLLLSTSGLNQCYQRSNERRRKAQKAEDRANDFFCSLPVGDPRQAQRHLVPVGSRFLFRFILSFLLQAEPLPGCPSCPPPSRLLPYPTLSTTRHPACQASLYIKIINIDHMNYSYSPV